MLPWNKTPLRKETLTKLLRIKVEEKIQSFLNQMEKSQTLLETRRYNNIENLTHLFSDCICHLVFTLIQPSSKCTILNHFHHSRLIVISVNILARQPVSPSAQQKRIRNAVCLASIRSAWLGFSRSGKITHVWKLSVTATNFSNNHDSMKQAINQ